MRLETPDFAPTYLWSSKVVVNIPIALLFIEFWPLIIMLLVGVVLSAFMFGVTIGRLIEHNKPKS